MMNEYGAMVDWWWEGKTKVPVRVPLSTTNPSRIGLGSNGSMSNIIFNFFIFNVSPQALRLRRAYCRWMVTCNVRQQNSETLNSAVMVYFGFSVRSIKADPGGRAAWWCHQQAASSVHYTTSCKHSLVLLRMGEIIARYRLSWLKLLINCYCCI